MTALLAVAFSATSQPARVAERADSRAEASLCGARETARLVDRFLVAFNGGDWATVRGFVGNGFVTYSMREGHLSRPPAPPRGGRFTVARSPTIVSYLQQRHRRGERQRLLVIEVNERYGKGTAGAGVYVTRMANDLASLGIRHRFATAKIEVDCEQERIVVWNMVMPRDPRPAPADCRRPRWWTGKRMILACRSSSPERLALVARSKGP